MKANMQQFRILHPSYVFSASDVRSLTSVDEDESITITCL